MHNRQKSALLCIPDTNSLINMSDIEIAKKDLRLWLWVEFDVKLSPTICTEIQNHRDLVKGGIRKRCNKSVWNFTIQLDRLEKTFLQPFYHDLNSRKDRGERHNCCVALDAVSSGAYRQVIFLTDELKTTDPERNGFLFRVFDSFPIGQIWSSLDFVLYLFLRHRNRFPFKIAQDVLRTINREVGGTEDAMRKRFIDYNRKLEKIKKTLSS